MIIVFTILAVVLIFVAALIYNDDLSVVVLGIGIFGLMICIIAMIILGVNVSKVRVIDDAIAMYEEENAEIEEQITAIVDNYMKHESDVFENVGSDSPIVLAQLYPELKADTLVNSQIDIFVKNNEKIKELKLRKINASVYRWWLYFGK